MAYRYMERLVCEFQDDDGVRLEHYNDLKFTSLTLFNTIVDGLRKGRMASFVDVVLDASKVIEETTLMRVQMKGDEKMYEEQLVYWHLRDDGKMCYRIPNKVNSFEAFRKKKSCKAKDYAVEIVTKMYRLHCINMKELKEECRGS